MSNPPHAHRRFPLHRSLLPGILLALSACAHHLPTQLAPRSGVHAALVDSVPWETEEGSGYLRRVEVRFGDAVDTVPGVLTAEAPLTVGARVLGFAYRDQEITGAYDYDAEHRRLQWDALPAGFNGYFSTPSLAPDGRHIAYIVLPADATAQAVVGTWPGRRVRVAKRHGGSSRDGRIGRESHALALAGYRGDIHRERSHHGSAVVPRRRLRSSGSRRSRRYGSPASVAMMRPIRMASSFRTRSSMNRGRALELLAVILAMTGCSHPTAVSDSRACQQTAEFGNSGCFDVAGEVVSTTGRTLGGIVVGIRPVTSSMPFNSPSQTTASDGVFHLRLSRMAGAPPPGGAPDTLSVYVVAADPGTAGLDIPARVRDSVLVTVTIAPVGAGPESVSARVASPVE